AGVAGSAGNDDSGTNKEFPEGGEFAGKSDYAFVAIATSDDAVKAIAQMSKEEKQTILEF
ncbi:MAG: hypothetical protein ACREBV_08185, partial [Candidatus Zixiibacteriota bacterium]